MPESFASSALVGMSISLFVLQKLVEKGVLSSREVSDLSDDALLKMEEFQSMFPENREDFEEARKLLDSVVRDYAGARPRYRPNS